MYGKQIDVRLDSVTHLVQDDPIRWPILCLALGQSMQRATNPKVEWTVGMPGYDTCNLGHQHLRQPESKYNYCQIFRSAQYTVSAPSIMKTHPLEFTARADHAYHRKYLCEMLDDLEAALRRESGPDVWPTHVRLMGGVPWMLGRWPRKTDEVSLAVLRDLRLYTEPMLDRDSYKCEWLIETSVRAWPGREDRP